MEKREGYLEFIVSENYRNQIDIWYKAHNISRERMELFYDFVVSLYSLIDETYLGNDVIHKEEDQRNHYTWCWDKVIENFNKENIHFKERGNHYLYFWNFFLEAYYFVKLYEQPVQIPDYFNKLFNFKHKKTRSELDLLSEIYKLLQHNLKK